MSETVHNRIAVLRAERDVSRRRLAEALGVHYQTIGYLERGEYRRAVPADRLRDGVTQTCPTRAEIRARNTRSISSRSAMVSDVGRTSSRQR